MERKKEPGFRRIPLYLPSVARVGFEPGAVLESTTIDEVSTETDPSPDELSPRSLLASGPNESQDGLNVDAALSVAVTAAAAAGRWDVVTQLARELEARRGR